MTKWQRRVGFAAGEGVETQTDRKGGKGTKRWRGGKDGRQGSVG